MLLVAPLFVLLLLSFCLPIAALLARAVYDPTMHDALPRTAAALDASPGQGVPDDAVFAALVEDLLEARQNDSLYKLAKDLNTLLPGGAQPRAAHRARPVARQAHDARRADCAGPVLGRKRDLVRDQERRASVHHELSARGRRPALDGGRRHRCGRAGSGDLSARSSRAPSGSPPASR